MKSLIALAALATLTVASIPPLSPVGQTGHLTATAPSKDGAEHLTVGYRLPGESTNRTLTATADDIHGKPRNSEDDPQMTPENKARALASALQETIDADNEERANQDPPLPPTGLAVTLILDSVTVGLPGGTITKVKKTNNTNEPRDTAMVSPPEGFMAMGEVSLEGAISGAASETGGTAQLWLQIGWEEYTIPTEQGMTMDELIRNVQLMLEQDGYRVMTAGQRGFAVVLPYDAPIFGVGSDDRALEVESFSAAIL